MAGKLEGHPVNSSQHAAGVVITAEPIANYVAIDHRTYSTMCDKKDAEDLNLLKIDMLGLTQLSIFSRALELAGIPFKGFFEKLPLDDKAAFKVLNDKHFSGVFQFNGIALQSLSKQVTIDKLEDIIAITALARPGAMASGNAGRWVKRRIGVEPVTYPHETFEPYLKDDLGVVIYQEQVLRIGREIGDLSWEDVTQLRKSMSKSLGAEYFDKWGIPWKAGARKKGIPENILDDMWKDLTAYGSWSFNRSHAVAYGLVSYYCCYLKAHYPLEFAAATLDAEALVPRQINTLRELENEGIGYLPVDAEASELRWAIKRGKTRADSMLVGPLTSIHGIGPKIADQILESRKSGKQLSLSVMQRLKNPKTFIDSLYPVTDALRRIDLKKLKVNSTPTAIINVQCSNVNNEFIVIGVASRIAPKDGNETVEIAKRGGKVMRGPTKALHLFIRDDTDTIFCKVNRYDFEKLGRPIVETGRAGHSIYAIKGSCPKDFRMLRISNIRYLGELDKLEDIDSNQDRSDGRIGND
jgi:DNA polymerase III alpha subunit